MMNMEYKLILFFLVALSAVVEGGNGRKGKVTSFTSHQNNKGCGDIVIVFDVSGSMGGQLLTKSKNAIVEWLSNNVPHGTMVGMIPFASYADPIKGFKLMELNSTSLTVMTDTINDLSAGGGTCYGAGLQWAIEDPFYFGNKTGGTILLIGDGRNGCSNPSLSYIKDLSVATKKTIFALNIANGMGTEIKNLISATNGTMFDVPADMNDDDFNGLLLEVCHDECDKNYIFPISCKDFCYGTLYKQCLVTSSCFPKPNNATGNVTTNSLECCLKKGREQCDKDCKPVKGFLASTLPEQCYDYHTLDQNSRLYTNRWSTSYTDDLYISDPKMARTSPDWKGYGFYRVVGGAGTQLLFDFDGNMDRSNRCGAPVTQYLTAKGDKSYDLPKNTGEAGFVYGVRDYGNGVKTFQSVLVYNCGDYYVYGLYEYDGPCTDRMRWCTTNGGQIQKPPATSPRPFYSI